MPIIGSPTPQELVAAVLTADAATHAQVLAALQTVAPQLFRRRLFGDEAPPAPDGPPDFPPIGPEGEAPP